MEVDVYQNYIDGKWVPAKSGATFEDRNPANWDEVVGALSDSEFAWMLTHEQPPPAA